MDVRPGQYGEVLGATAELYCEILGILESHRLRVYELFFGHILSGLSVLSRSRPVLEKLAKKVKTFLLTKNSAPSCARKGDSLLAKKEKLMVKIRRKKSKQNAKLERAGYLQTEPSGESRPRKRSAQMVDCCICQKIVDLETEETFMAFDIANLNFRNLLVKKHFDLRQKENLKLNHTGNAFSWPDWFALYSVSQFELDES